MIPIVVGMTPTRFIATLNDNFNDLSALAGGVSITTVTASNYITAINNNMAAINAVTTNPISPHLVEAGDADVFITNLNLDFNALETDFINDPLVPVLNYTLLPTGYIWAAVKGAIIYATNSDRQVAKSIDFGMTWTIFSTIFEYPLTSIFVSKDGILFTCSGKDIWKSSDDGLNWIKVFTTTVGHILPWAWTQASGGNIFAGEYNLIGLNSVYVWRSTNNGVSWTRLDGLVGFASQHIHNVFVDPETDRLYVTIGDDNKRTYYSDDSGANWTQIFDAQTTGFTGMTSIVGARFFADDLGHDLNNIWKSTNDSTLVSVYAFATNSNYPYGSIVAVHGGTTLFAMTYNEFQEVDSTAVIIKSINSGTNWTTLVTAPVGSYHFTMPMTDYRHRIPAEMPYFICNAGTRMIRIAI